MKWNVAHDVENAACGSMHTLLLTKTGQVYSCGNNDHGQLGHTLSRKRPRMSMFRMCSKSSYFYKFFVILSLVVSINNFVDDLFFFCYRLLYVNIVYICYM